eukprot:scaffold75874_cov34-Tisochrysis_lutea.AAC.3
MARRLERQALHRTRDGTLDETRSHWAGRAHQVSGRLHVEVEERRRWPQDGPLAVRRVSSLTCLVDENLTAAVQLCQRLHIEEDEAAVLWVVLGEAVACLATAQDALDPLAAHGLADRLHLIAWYPAAVHEQHAAILAAQRCHDVPARSRRSTRRRSAAARTLHPCWRRPGPKQHLLGVVEGSRAVYTPVLQFRGHRACVGREHRAERLGRRREDRCAALDELCLPLIAVELPAGEGSGAEGEAREEN